MAILRYLSALLDRSSSTFFLFIDEALKWVEIARGLVQDASGAKSEVVLERLNKFSGALQRCARHGRNNGVFMGHVSLSLSAKGRDKVPKAC